MPDDQIGAAQIRSQDFEFLTHRLDSTVLLFNNNIPREHSYIYIYIYMPYVIGHAVVASFLGLPRFLFFSLRSDTRQKSGEKRGTPGNTYFGRTPGGRRGGGGARLQILAQ